MQSESQCRFCAKLPVVHHLRTGMPTRCPLCKGQLIEDRGAGTTYRFAEPSELPPPSKSLARRLAALLGLSATVALVWLLVKPHAPETTVAAHARPSTQNKETAQVEEQPVADAGNVGQAFQPDVNELLNEANYKKTAAGLSELNVAAKPPAGDTKIAGKAYVFKSVAKNRPLYADGFYSRLKTGNYVRGMGFTESELRIQLDVIPEVGLTQKKTTRNQKDKPSSKLDHDAYLADLEQKNPQARGLPFLTKNCQLSAQAAQKFDGIAKSYRAVFDAVIPDEDTSYPSGRRRSVRGGDSAMIYRFNQIKLGHKSGPDSTKQPLPSEAVAPLQQLLMDQDMVSRRVLVGYLQEISDRQATIALARRAIFDLDPENRERAVQSLDKRAPEDYTPVFLEGLRYPWPNVAHNAASALVKLKRSDVVPHLAMALGQPDPDVPFTEAGVTKVHELVRVNHYRNCLMCHAPSYSREDPVRAGIPSPDDPLPSPFSVEYYSSSESFVRADVTYLRQDFSAAMKVSASGDWRSTQRFDFLVRVRELTKEESASFQKKQRPKSSEYRTAILFALQELTGPYLESAISTWEKGAAKK